MFFLPRLVSHKCHSSFQIKLQFDITNLIHKKKFVFCNKINNLCEFTNYVYDKLLNDNIYTKYNDVNTILIMRLNPSLKVVGWTID